MPRYRKLLRRVDSGSASVRDLRQIGDAEPVAAEEPEVSYRDLQQQAKEAGIPANQSREDLEAALDD